MVEQHSSESSHFFDRACPGCVEVEEGFEVVGPRRPVPVGTTLGDYLVKALVENKEKATQRMRKNTKSTNVLSYSKELGEDDGHDHDHDHDPTCQCPGTGSAPPAEELAEGLLCEHDAERQALKTKHAGERHEPESSSCVLPGLSITPTSSTSPTPSTPRT